MKKSTMRCSKKIKYLFVTRGPGETSQARALAKFIFGKGGEIYFAPHQKITQSFLEKDKKDFKILSVERSKKLIRWDILIRKIKPDVLLLFNSKMWGWNRNFRETPPLPKPITVCIDSNWLFNERKYPWYPFVKWADKYLINIPKEIFTLGLRENGGNFIIPKNMQERIIPIGFIPSYKKPSLEKKLKIRKKYKIKKDEKFIFSYFSGFGAGHRTWAFDNLIRAVKILIKKGLKIKVIYIGPTKDLDQEKLKEHWLVLKPYLDIDEYYLTLASSDLIFQHQGLATLSQAISAQVPVIANVSRLSRERLQRIHFWEVGPFVKAGTCLMLHKSTPINEIAKKIEGLLYNLNERKRMQKFQKKYYIPGEERAYKIIKDLLTQTTN